MNTFDTIEQKIIEALNISWKEVNRGDWNPKIKKILEVVGKENYRSKYEFKVAASGITNEWLYDLVWSEHKYEEKYDGDLEISTYSLRNVALVAEIEWENNFDENIQPDFQKLLVARAEHRLMVFRAENEIESKKYFKYLDEIVDNFILNKKGDRYMYAAQNNNGKFLFQLKIVQ